MSRLALWFLALAPLTAAAKPTHTLEVGLLAGVDFAAAASPRVVTGIPHPLPSPRLGWTMEPERTLPWIGLHTSPTFMPVLQTTASGDVVSQMVAPALLAFDFGLDPFRFGATRVGPYGSVGFLSGEMGVRLRTQPGPVGLEVRAGWHALKTVGLSVNAAFALGRKGPSRPELPDPA